MFSFLIFLYSALGGVVITWISLEMCQWKVDKSRGLFGEMVCTQGETTLMGFFAQVLAFIPFSAWPYEIHEYTVNFLCIVNLFLLVFGLFWKQSESIFSMFWFHQNQRILQLILMPSENISCGFFISICFVANSGESALAWFLREIAWGVVFFTGVILLWGDL